MIYSQIYASIYVCMSWRFLRVGYNFFLNLHFTIPKIKYYPLFTGYWVVQIWFDIQHEKNLIYRTCTYDNNLPRENYFNVYEPLANILTWHLTFQNAFVYVLLLDPTPGLTATCPCLHFYCRGNKERELLNLWDLNVAVNESGHIKFFPVLSEWGPRRTVWTFIQKQNMLVLGLQTAGKEASVGCKESELTFGRAKFQVTVG